MITEPDPTDAPAEAKRIRRKRGDDLSPVAAAVDTCDKALESLPERQRYLVIDLIIGLHGPDLESIIRKAAAKLQCNAVPLGSWADTGNGSRQVPVPELPKPVGDDFEPHVNQPPIGQYSVDGKNSEGI
jgi:hypothetical protein